MQIDLNADVGEGSSLDAELIPLVSSVNIACGGHAGSPQTMRETVRLALAHGVAIGAHPGYPDPEHFGRRSLTLSPEALRETLTTQLQTLASVARAEGARLLHVKPHGALYNQAADDPALAELIAATIFDFDPRLRLVGLAQSASIRAAQHAGLEVIEEAFVDRRYRADARLVPRTEPQAVYADTADALAQSMSIVSKGTVRAVNGEAIALHADTLGLHSDTSTAVCFARTLRQALQAAGIAIASPCA